jgi:hypothetical protein
VYKGPFIGKPYILIQKGRDYVLTDRLYQLELGKSKTFIRPSILLGNQWTPKSYIPSSP